MVRQILGAVSEFEKAQIVSKLKAARTRKREGGKSYKELDPALAREAKRFWMDGLILAKVSSMLFEQGYKTSTGIPLAAAQVSRFVA